jgi:hypothetical protein
MVGFLSAECRIGNQKRGLEALRGPEQGGRVQALKLARNIHVATFNEYEDLARDISKSAIFWRLIVITAMNRRFR